MKYLLALCLFGLPGWAFAADVETGHMAFVDACASCHGETAVGGGPKAAMLSTPVPDLTRIAERADGTYDMGRIVRIIDGREGMAAHGGPMPMFGGLLTGPSAVLDAPDGTVLSTTDPILSIALWLEAQQVE